MHEQSETVEHPEGGWQNVYGQALPKAGQPLPLKYGYERERYGSLEDAVSAAKRRSNDPEFGDTKVGRRVAPRATNPEEWGLSPDYKPPAPAGIYEQLLQLLADPGNKDLLSVLYSKMLESPGLPFGGGGVIGNTRRIGKIFARDPIPPDSGGHRIPLDKLMHDAPLKGSLELEGITNPSAAQLRESYLDGLKGAHGINDAMRGYHGPLDQLRARELYESIPPNQRGIFDHTFRGQEQLERDIQRRLKRPDPLSGPTPEHN